MEKYFNYENELYEKLFSVVRDGNLEELKSFFPEQQNFYHNGDVFGFDGITVGNQRGFIVDVNYKYNNASLLNCAAIHKRVDCARFMLDKGALINEISTFGCTALWLACDRKDVEMVGVLLSHGADIELSDNAKNTPLMQASLRGSHEIVKLLLEHGANIWATNNRGGIARDKAIINNDTEMLDILDNYQDLMKEQKKLEKLIDDQPRLEQVIKF